MKKSKIIYGLLILLITLGSVSCRENEMIADDIDIPGLGGTGEVENDLDRWIFSNFTDEYNIEVVYRWDAAQMYSSLTTTKLVPVQYDKVTPMMAALRDVWFEPYNKVVGSDFIKLMAPKKVVLVGSPEYVNGAIKLGQAEGGRKILLLNANNFDASDETILRRDIQTIQHEFAHILHQTILFDKTYQDISAGYYDASGWQEYSDEMANHRGFISSYSMSGKDEDFVEVLSMVLVYGREWYENVVLVEAAKSTEMDAVAVLNKKLSMVESYMLSAWGVRLFDNVLTGEKGLESYVQDAVNEVVASPPTE